MAAKKPTGIINPGTPLTPKAMAGLKAQLKAYTAKPNHYFSSPTVTSGGTSLSGTWSGTNTGYFSPSTTNSPLYFSVTGHSVPVELSISLLTQMTDLFKRGKTPSIFGANEETLNKTGWAVFGLSGRVVAELPDDVVVVG